MTLRLRHDLHEDPRHAAGVFVVRGRGAALVAAGLLALLGGCTGAGQPAEPGTSPPPAHGERHPDEYAAELADLTNRARVDQGLDPLTRSECAATAGRQRAAALRGAALEHRPMQAVNRRCEAGTVAENLFAGDATPAEVVEAWMGSPGHRNNIVDPTLQQIGVGCVHEERGLLCSEIFLGDADDSPTATPSTR